MIFILNKYIIISNNKIGGEKMEKEKKEISRKTLIGIIIILLVIIIALIIVFLSKKDNNNETSNVKADIENKDVVNNIFEEENNVTEGIQNYTISSNAINYIEIEMPNLIGKQYMDIIYNYNLKENILNQLYEKDLEGTTFNLNALKYIGDGSIFINGSYIIEGYGYEVEKQTPEAGSKIKIFNDGEGNVHLGENIYLYIKGGGRTETIDIDNDKRKASNYTYNTDEDVSTNDYEENNSSNQSKTYTYSVISGCTVTDFDSNSGRISYKQKCENCGWTSTTTKSSYISSGRINTSFKCPDCKRQQKLSIEGSSK